MAAFGSGLLSCLEVFTSRTKSGDERLYMKTQSRVVKHHSLMNLTFDKSSKEKPFLDLP